jgi:hypothetical protein
MDEFISVQDYITDVRTVILDKIPPFRYDDDSLLRALNIALLEASRLRPDFFPRYRYHARVPQFDAVSGDMVPIEQQFRMGFIFGICAHALLRDEEDVQDARANNFLERFHDILVGVRPTPVTGATPGPGQAGRLR